MTNYSEDLNNAEEHEARAEELESEARSERGAAVEDAESARDHAGDIIEGNEE